MAKLPDAITLTLTKREYIGIPLYACGEYLLTQLSDQCGECHTYAVSKWNESTANWEDCTHPEIPSELFGKFRVATGYEEGSLRLR